MKKFMSVIFATFLAAASAIANVAPTAAAPIFVPKMHSIEDVSSKVVQVGHRKRIIRHGGGNFHRYGRSNRYANRNPGYRYGGQHPRYYRHPGYRQYGNKKGWYNGHRGYRHHRPGYRYYGGWWYPGAAFIAGAVIGGYGNYYDDYNGGDSHVAWCYNRYRSYRAWDNTFQPYHGPRRQCFSPYR